MGKRAAKDKETLVVRCSRCENAVQGSVEGAFHREDESGNLTEFLLLKCGNCGAALLATRELEWDGDEWIPDPAYVIYPESQRGLSRQIPQAIRSAYEEAATCYSGGNYTASALMVRRALQALVSIKLGEKAEIFAGLKQMREAGQLDPELYKWADELRAVGNEAAHDFNETITKQTALDLLEFAHAIIEYLFTFKEKFVEFQKRRESSQQRSVRQVGRRKRTDIEELMKLIEVKPDNPPSSDKTDQA